MAAAKLDVERKVTRADGRIKILLRPPGNGRDSITLCREGDDASEFSEGAQVDRTPELDAEGAAGHVRPRPTTPGGQGVRGR